MRNKKTLLIVIYSLMLLALIGAWLLFSSKEKPLSGATASETVVQINDDKSAKALTPLRQEAWMKDASNEIQGVLEAQNFIDKASVLISDHGDDQTTQKFSIVLDGTDLQAHADEVIALIRDHADAFNLDFEQSAIVDVNGTAIDF